jgi:hypothetical protein
MSDIISYRDKSKEGKVGGANFTRGRDKENNWEI